MDERQELDMLFLKKMSIAVELQAIKDYCFLRRHNLKRYVKGRGSVTEIRIFFHNIDRISYLDRVDELLDQEEKKKKRMIKHRGKY